MIKILTLALTISALTLGASFAGNGNCKACCGGKDKPAPTATPAP
jgi:hypothetical protein